MRDISFSRFLKERAFGQAGQGEEMAMALETFCTQFETRVDFFIFLPVTH
jgi:hypothetical protein